MIRARQVWRRTSVGYLGGIGALRKTVCEKNAEADVTEHYKIIAPPLTPPNNPSKKPMPRSDDRRALGLTGAKPEHWAAKRRANTVFMVSWC